MEELIS